MGCSSSHQSKVLISLATGDPDTLCVDVFGPTQSVAAEFNVHLSPGPQSFHPGLVDASIDQGGSGLLTCVYSTFAGPDNTPTDITLKVGPSRLVVPSGKGAATYMGSPTSGAQAIAQEGDSGAGAVPRPATNVRAWLTAAAARVQVPPGS